MKKRIAVLRSTKGFSFVWTSVILLAILALTATIFEAYRLSAIASSVRGKFQEIMISEAADNYKKMLNTTRDGFAGSQNLSGESWDFGGITTKTRVLSSLDNYLNKGEKSQIIVRSVDYYLRVPQSDSERWYTVGGTVTVDVPGVFSLSENGFVTLKIDVTARWRGEF